VRACAEAGTHYVDLTGEPEFVDSMIERYHATAAASRAKIVHACGFDSVPHDLGAYYSVQQLAAGAPSGSLSNASVVVEGFVRATGTFSGGTWHSALTIMGRMRSYERERKRNPLQLPQVGEGRSIEQLPLRIAHRKEIGAWAVPLPTIDPQVVCRSARLLPQYGRDFSYGHYAAVRHLPTIVFGGIGLGALFTLAQWQPTRSLLLDFRKPGEGPDERTRAKSWFSVRFVARSGDQRVTCEVRGGDPGYDETAKMLAESALCLAQDEGLPEHAGVVPPAAAMGDALIARLQAAGITFERTQ
jgi:saccharopine dehydrogenase (NAD+, L-glutamate forming)